MNTRQAVVLVAGAIAVIIVVFTAPRVYLLPPSSGSQLLLRYDSPTHARYQNVKPIVDLPAALLRIAGVIGATLLISYAVKRLPEGRRLQRMNKRKGFFRLTLVVSFLCGILAPYFSDNILKSDIFRSTGDRTIEIPLPSDWKNKTLQEKLDLIDKLDTKLRDWSEATKKSVSTDVFGDNEISFKVIGGILFRPADYYKLSPREKRDVKKQLRERIISDDRKMPKEDYDPAGLYSLKETEKGLSYDVYFNPDWIKRSLLTLIVFGIGFALVWLIYGFIRWVVIGFIIKGFKYKGIP